MGNVHWVFKWGRSSYVSNDRAWLWEWTPHYINSILRDHFLWLCLDTCLEGSENGSFVKTDPWLRLGDFYQLITWSTGYIRLHLMIQRFCKAIFREKNWIEKSISNTRGQFLGRIGYCKNSNLSKTNLDLLQDKTRVLLSRKREGKLQRTYFDCCDFESQNGGKSWLEGKLIIVQKNSHKRKGW